MPGAGRPRRWTTRPPILSHATQATSAPEGGEPVPGPHAIAMIAVTVLVFYLYTRPWIRMEYVSLILLTTLLVMFYVFPYEGHAGQLTDLEVFRAFGHPALVAICSLMILGRGLTMTGAMEPAVRALGKLWRLN
jgi:hypothetical protein